MKKTLLAILLIASAVASEDLFYQPEEVFTFDYDCYGNANCLAPGEEYCGHSEVYSVECINNSLCVVGCKPLDSGAVDEEWEYSYITIVPKDKRTGKVITLSLTDSRTGEPLIWDVEVYFGGGWEHEIKGEPVKLFHGGLVSNITLGMVYAGGELILSEHTDRQGVLTFTPPKPGYYVVKTLGRYFRFIVGDKKGKQFSCGNGECESVLGEMSSFCPLDCKNETPTNGSLRGGLEPITEGPQALNATSESAMENASTPAKEEVSSETPTAKPKSGSARKFPGGSGADMGLLLAVSIAGVMVLLLFLATRPSKKAKAPEKGE